MRSFRYKLLIKLLLIFLGYTGTSINAAENKFTVVIDAGHGGKDIGATDNGVMEKNINLKVARQLESLIKKNLKNTKVVMTRDDDTYLTLQQRADKANKAKGDIFISIHTNSVDKKNKNRRNIAGSSVYTLGLHKDENNLEVAMRENSVIELEKDYEQKYSGFDPQRDESYIIFEMAQKKNLSQSIKLAESIEKELVKSGRNHRGVHQAGFWVLWATSMPSVLVELDFICNPESAKYLASDKGAKELAEAIFKAVKQYESTWNKSVKAGASGELGDTYIEDEPSELTDTYTVLSTGDYAKARNREPRSHNTTIASTSTTTTKKVTSGQRRRRSARAKALSMNKDYEQETLSLATSKNYASASPVVEEKEVVMAVNTNKGDSKSKTKEKKQEKEKKKEKTDKKKEEKQDKQRNKDAYNARINKLVTVYKIQVLASYDLLTQGNARFCGLSPISAYKENNMYKYYYGESTDKAELERLLPEVQKKIPDAFIVASQKTIQK